MNKKKPSAERSMVWLVLPTVLFFIIYPFFGRALNIQENGRILSATPAWIFPLVAIMLLLLTMIVVLGKFKLHLKEHKGIKERIERDWNRIKLNEGKLLIKLQHKNRELAITTLTIIQKKQMIESVLDQIENIKKQSSVNREIFDNLFCRSLESVEKDWENFKLYFGQIHEGLFESLKSGSPNLTENDLKWIALLRLNLDSRQIASILNVSFESVKVIRHRLRKKLNVPEETNLFDFLNKFEDQRMLKVA